MRMTRRLESALAALTPMDENRLSALAGRAEQDAQNDATVEADFRDRPAGQEQADALAASGASFARVAEVLRAVLDANEVEKVIREC